MNALIKIGAKQVGAQTVQTASARELHAFLEVGRDFSNWIKDRIEQYGFEEGQDYVVLLAKTGENLVGRPSREYAVTLDMAKELAMVERNAKGKQARKYFIECERIAKSPSSGGAPALPLREQVDAGILLLRAAAEDLKFAPSALLGSYQKLENHVGVAGLLPAYAVDASATSTAGSSEETKSAKDLLEIHGVGMSAVAFNRLLVQRGFLEERERPSTKGSGLKKFKVCANLVFGKNLTSASNPRETQPHWYVSKFAELLDLVLPTKRGAAA